MSSPATQSQPAIAPNSGTPLLDVRNLEVHFPFQRGPFYRREKGFIRAVDGISFQVHAGETLGIVGESGCGKSTAARAILNLVRPTGGDVFWQGQSIAGLSDRAMLPFRRQMQMIFQDPFASLNPRMTVGAIIGEPMRIFGQQNARERKLDTMRLMDMVGLNPRFLNRYPHEFSGGQRQRIGIARALAVQPKLIICDEPVSALDVSIQAQVINLLQDLQRQLGLAYIFIAHDLSVVRHISDRVGVMYLGKIVELSAAEQLYKNPLHPYTQALLSAAPTPDPMEERSRKRIVLSGEVPSPDKVYAGCRFADRCPVVRAECRIDSPPLSGHPHEVACFVANEQR